MKNTQQIVQNPDGDNKLQSPTHLAQMGIDDYAYLRSVEFGDLAKKFEIQDLEEISKLSNHNKVWVLFSADGMPLALGMDAADLHMQASELELDAVFLH